MIKKPQAPWPMKRLTRPLLRVVQAQGSKIDHLVVKYQTVGPRRTRAICGFSPRPGWWDEVEGVARPLCQDCFSGIPVMRRAAYIRT